MMLKKIQSIMLVLILMLCVASPAFASDIVSIDSATYQSGVLTVSGYAGDSANSAVTLWIYRESAGAVTYADICAGKALAKIIYTGEDGEYLEKIGLGSLFSSNKYTVEIRLGDASAAQNFMHVNEKEAESSLAKLNAASTESDFAKIIQDNLVNFGINNEVYEGKEECVNAFLFAHRPDSGYTSSSLLDEYNRALCVYELKYTDGSLDEIMSDYSSFITTAYSDISGYGKDVVANLRARLKDETYAQYNIDEAIEKNLWVSRIVCTERYTVLQSVMEDSLDELELSLTSYNRLKEKAEAYRIMFSNKSEIDAYNDIDTVFQAAVASALKAQNNQSQGGGSGGGGGGSFAPINTVNISSGVTPEDITPGVVQPIAPNGFSDTKGHWALVYIDELAQSGAINGYEDGSFRPDGNITRAEFVKIIIAAFKIDLSASSSTFADVADGDWYADYVMTAAQNGLVNGADGKFRPNDRITRQDAALVLYRLIKDVAENAEAVSFEDSEKIADYAKEAVARLAGLGIINGSNNNFAPDREITRAEAAAMIVRIEK